MRLTHLNRHLKNLWSCEVGEGDGLGGRIFGVEA